MLRPSLQVGQAITLILNQPAAPGAHALVIGIGDYPWLPGGSQPTFAKHGGMGQLSSAPVSARELARWFLTDFVNPSFPRASLDLLLSDAAGNQFTDPSGQTHTIGRATFANVETAVLDWFQRGTGNPDNLMILFYCGHGLGKGKQTILLAEDFGSLPDSLSLKFAVDFDQFYLGMDQCAARQQCFFVDACRVGSPFALNTLSYFGNPLVPPGAKVAPTPRSAPVYYSAVPGATAFGRPGKTSFFTEALLNAFRGAGADDATGSWTVPTDALHRGIHVHLQRSVARSAAQGQLSLADGISAPFDLHHLAGDPVVPVEVTCSPDSHNAGGALRVVSGNGSLLTPPAPAQGPWDLDLPYGRYRFELGLPSLTAPLNPVDREVRPPYRKVEFPVP